MFSTAFKDFPPPPFFPPIVIKWERQMWQRVHNKCIAEGERLCCSISDYFTEVQASHGGWWDSFIASVGARGKSALELEYAPGIVFSESLETCESPPWRYNLQIIFINSKLPASPVLTLQNNSVGGWNWYSSISLDLGRKNEINIAIF